MAQFYYNEAQNSPHRKKININLWMFFACLLGREGLTTAFVTFMVWLASFVFTHIGGNFATFTNREIVRQIILIISYAGPFLLFILVYACTTHMSIRELLPADKIGVPTFLAGVGVCIGLTIAGGYLSAVLEQIANYMGIIFVQPQTYIPVSNLATIFFVINYAILPPLFEEVIFRSISLNALRKTGYVGCVFVSAVVFALAHGNILQIPMAFCMGAGAAYFVLRFHNIWIGITAHFINNGLYVLFELMKNNISLANTLNLFFGVFAVIAMIAGILYLIYQYGEHLDDFGMPALTKSIRAVVLNPIAIILTVIYVSVVLSNINFIRY